MNMTFLDAGQLTARLDLESPVEAPDGQGGVTVSHAVESSHWARVEPVSAEHGELGHVERQSVTHRIWMGRDRHCGGEALPQRGEGVRHPDGARPG